MPALYDMKAFYRFLEEATMEELISKRDKVENLIHIINNDAVVGDAKYLIRKIEEEMLSRTQRLEIILNVIILFLFSSICIIFLYCSSSPSIMASSAIFSTGSASDFLTRSATHSNS